MAEQREFTVEGEQAGSLATEFGALTGRLLAARSVHDVLDWVRETAERIVDGATMVSITLRAEDGTFHTPCPADEVAAKLDQVQYDTGEGPCVTAAQMTGPGYSQSNDLANEPAWPTFGPAAADHGFDAVLATALISTPNPGEARGALNIYAAGEHRFTRADVDTALLLATHAGLALAHTEAVTAAELQETQLRQAVDSRDVIGQAKGILMTRRGIDADAAFAILRSTSQNLNVKLTELAGTLATRHEELDLPQS